MQATQCNWRIVKDWKNSLFIFFILCYFLDRDTFNSFIPYLGKNILESFFSIVRWREAVKNYFDSSVLKRYVIQIS